MNEDVYLIERFLEMMTSERGAARNTVESYARDLREAAAFLNDKISDFAMVDKKLLETYVVKLVQSGLAPRTVARHISSLRQLFHFLYSDGGRKDNPAISLDIPKQPRKLPPVLSGDDISAMITAAGNDFRLVAMLELLYASGMRISELVTLPLATIQNVNKGSKFITVRGKGNKERMVPLHTGAVSSLFKYLETRKEVSIWLFPAHSREGHITRQGFARMMKDIAWKAGLDPRKVSPHMLRHSFASALLTGGADLRVIQELLGHSDISTTQVYTHIEQDRLTRLVTQHHPLSKRKLGTK